MKVKGHDLRRVMSASSLTGDRVINSRGEDLGKVEEFMIDLGTSRIAYVVLSFGGVLGIGSTLFAIPFEAFSLDEDKHAFILDVPQEKLEKATGFDKDNWPDMADPSWGTQLHDYYGLRPYWTQSPSSLETH